MMVGLILSILLWTLKILYPVILVIGFIISWKRAFREGAVFFFLMFMHHIINLFYDNSFLVHIPTLADTGLLLIITVAVSSLLIGIYKKSK